jgi:sugar/nucleoside kinase (ribokinase family)
MHGQVGDDEESYLVIDAFHRDFCHLSLYRSPGATGRTLIFVRPGGERIMRSDVGVVMQYNRMDALRTAIKQGAWLHLTGYLLDPQFPIHRVAWVTMDASGSRSVPVSMDIGSGAYLGRELLRDVVAKYLTVIFLNHTEAKDMGFFSAQSAAEEIIGWVDGRRDAIVVITQGKDDVLVRRGGKTIFVPTNQVPVRDTTGAGDSFVAGFLYAFSKSAPLEECAILGCSEAAKTIQVLGGVPDHYR